MSGYECNYNMGGIGGPQRQNEKYIPPEPSNEEEEIFSSGISSGINFDKYDRARVQVSGESVPSPCESFEDCQLHEIVFQNIIKCSYKKPTPVQKHAIPIITADRDLMACAQTGSGKTAAFLLPIIDKLMSNNEELIITSNHIEPQVLIVTPTRELSVQIFNEARKFAHLSSIKIGVAYGGTAVTYQVQKLMRGCHILVATVGRLFDFVRRGLINFCSIKIIVLDEADRMLDMGFFLAVKELLEHPTMPKSCQKLMFSATFPSEIQTLASKYLKDYLFLVVGIMGGACSDVDQVFHDMRKFYKRDKLIDILMQSEGRELTLVFVEMKKTADFLAAFLCEQNFRTTSIHGDRYQSQREQALADFKSGRMPILVATAVASRGLDIKNVGHVVNYDLPKTAIEYVHRIGRTGRVGNRGRATSFYDSERDNHLARDLVQILEQAGQEAPFYIVDDMLDSGSSSLCCNSNTDVRQKGILFGNPDNLPRQLEQNQEW